MILKCGREEEGYLSHLQALRYVGSESNKLVFTMKRWGLCLSRENFLLIHKGEENIWRRGFGNRNFQRCARQKANSEFRAVSKRCHFFFYLISDGLV